MSHIVSTQHENVFASYQAKMYLFEDDILGGYGICVSSQLRHLPGTGGGPQTPKGMAGTLSDR